MVEQSMALVPVRTGNRIVGAGSVGAFVVLLGALHGTWLYGLVRTRLPH